ncbi:3-dehydroquinate dehydratase [Eubacterium ruminantium]|nr:3-dehydroquinate dehydratase [Eubacterium ruminantium]
MNEVTVKNCIFGNGIPKICVPLIGGSREEILANALVIKKEAESLENEYRDKAVKVDVIEFRADYYNEVTDRHKLENLMAELREIFSDRLILFTYRSEDEGGELRHDRAESMIEDIWEWVIAGKMSDIIDIELKSGNYRVARAAVKAHEAGMAVIMSNHNFEKTPHNEEILEMFREMEILGADILKMASFPRSHFDVDRMVELTKDISSGKVGAAYIRHPVIIISMGKEGVVTRTKCKENGCAMTFSSVGSGSAPGQVSLREMFEIVSADK